MNTLEKGIFELKGRRVRLANDSQIFNQPVSPHKYSFEDTNFPQTKTIVELQKPPIANGQLSGNFPI